MDISGITAYSMQMAQIGLMQEVGVRVLDNAIEQMEQTGQQMTEALQASVPYARFDGLGTVVDIWV